MDNCELFGHLCFAMPPIPHRFAHLDSHVNIGFWAYIGLQK